MKKMKDRGRADAVATRHYRISKGKGSGRDKEEKEELKTRKRRERKKMVSDILVLPYNGSVPGKIKVAL